MNSPMAKPHLWIALIVILPVTVFVWRHQQHLAEHAAGAAYMPTLERLEVVTSSAGSTNNSSGGNQWGSHKNRIIRTPDGNLYTVVQGPGTDDNLNKQWLLYKR